jgi:FkbM family methyltransferase
MTRELNQTVINLSGLPPTTLVGKIARWPLKALPRNLTVRILQGQLKGKKWIVGSTRHACWLGSYEVHIQNVIAQEVERGGVFFDVGANVGFYSLLASSLIDPGKVYAFEPLPANVCYIKKHLQLNKIQNVEVLEVGVSDQQGMASFRDEETRGMGRLQPGGNLSVRTVTLDQLLQEQRIAPPNCIKMDIEGAEFRALSGARACFQNHKPTLILATHGREVHGQCCQLLHSWGYDCRLLQGGPEEDRAELIAMPRRPELSAR